MEHLKSSLSIRGDSLYCPLPLSLDSYWGCLPFAQDGENGCLHCYLRRFDHTWGKAIRPMDVTAFVRKLESGLRNKHPKSPLAYALAHKKTMRWGNKSDPFQPIEKELKISNQVLFHLRRLDWTFVLNTMCSDLFMEMHGDSLHNYKDIMTFQPIVSPGLEKDWEQLEFKRTTNPFRRLAHAGELLVDGFKVGVNGEPFIPGYHTEKDFEKTMMALQAHGLPAYNTYNFHFNEFVAKRMCEAGIDIEKIWFYNQNAEWAKILPRLLAIADKYGIKVGCPDFVNTGMDRREPFNTCCGIDVDNPCTFNTHRWKRDIQAGIAPDSMMLDQTWDGVGDYEEGKKVLTSKSDKFFSMADAMNVRPKKGFDL